jgi:hypothetical protein
MQEKPISLNIYSSVKKPYKGYVFFFIIWDINILQSHKTTCICDAVKFLHLLDWNALYENFVY